MSRSAGPEGQDTDWPPGTGQPYEEQPVEEPAQPPAGAPSGGEPPGGEPRRWLGHPLTLVVAGAVALVAGAGIALAAVRVVDPPPAGGTTPVSSAPAPSSSSGTSGNGASGSGASPAALPPLGGSGGQPMRQLMIMGGSRR